MILITTSHKPTQRIRTLCNDFIRVIPNSIRINRGKLNIKGLFEEALASEANRLMIVERWKGGPGSIKLAFSPFTSDCTIKLIVLSVKTQDDIGRRRKINNGLTITVQSKSSPKVIDLANFFSRFLNIPFLDSVADEIESGATVHFSDIDGKVKIAFRSFPHLEEIGPTLTVKKISNNQIKGDK